MSKGLSVVNQQRKLSKWAERVSACRSSGLSVKTWCRENGVSEQTYYKWQRRLYELAQNRQGNRFAEITPQAMNRSRIAVPFSLVAWNWPSTMAQMQQQYLNEYVFHTTDYLFTCPAQF